MRNVLDVTRKKSCWWIASGISPCSGSQTTNPNKLFRHRNGWKLSLVCKGHGIGQSMIFTGSWYSTNMRHSFTFCVKDEMCIWQCWSYTIIPHLPFGRKKGGMPPKTKKLCAISIMCIYCVISIYRHFQQFFLTNIVTIRANDWAGAGEGDWVVSPDKVTCDTHIHG
jgi:hypothetical protein